MNKLVSIITSKWFPYVLIAVLVIILYFSFQSISNKNNEIKRLELNQEALYSELEVVENKFGQEVARVQALELSKNEFEKLYQAETAKVKALNLKVKRLETYTQTVIHTTDTVFITVAPPIIKDSVTIRKFEYNDEWASISGSLNIKGDLASSPATVDIAYQTRDTLDVMLYRVPKKCWFIRWGTKRFDCYIQSQNPNSEVVVGSCTIVNSKRKR